MNNTIVTVFILLNLISSNTQKSQTVELYITPRNVRYGWYDNGVFQFKLNKKSIIKPYEERTYSTLNASESVFELFYTKTKIPSKLFNDLVPQKNIPVDIKRIMIVVSCKDTMFIDKNYNLIKQDKCYKMSNSLKNILEKCMPIGIRENWINNLPGR